LALSRTEPHVRLTLARPVSAPAPYGQPLVAAPRLLRSPRAA